MPVYPLVEQKSCRRLVRLVACAALFAGGLVGFAQDPPEAVDPKGGLKKPVLAPDGPEPKPRRGSGNTPDVRLDSLAREAAAARHPDVKALLVKYVVPFDQITDKHGMSRIRPFE